ncbi:dUTP diphosphatase [bacterium]|nr:dUTP diphosphatase [bacterium]|tara:strand:- start:189 stop:608 length:420 start_codon:yes stop_codon:yes gene_type:complete
MKILVKKLSPDAVTPDYAYPGDAGLDLYCIEDHKLEPNTKHPFHIGISIEFPDGYVGLVKDKGGMGARAIHCTGGVIDAGYRGEYVVMLVNLGTEAYEFKKGDKIAQLVICPVARAEVEEVDELSESERGGGHHGSSGR